MANDKSNSSETSGATSAMPMLLKRLKTAIGAVSGVGARNRRAPNSPAARASARTAPIATPRDASGRAIRQKTLHGGAPSVAATASNSSSTLWKAASALLPKNGMATNVWARQMPNTVPSKQRPN